MMHKALLPIMLAMAASAAQASRVIDITDPKQPDWTQVVLRDEGPATVSASTQNGAGNELGSWRVGFAIPETTAPFTSSHTFAAIYEADAWSPQADGGIERIDVNFGLTRTSSTFANGFAGYVRPVVRQSGVIYSVGFSSVEVDGSFNPSNTATWSLRNTDNWVTLDGGTGLDLSANGDPIHFGFRWDLGAICNGSNGCTGVATVANLNQLHFDISAVSTVSAVPEPGVLSMFLIGLGLLGVSARHRKVKMS